MLLDLWAFTSVFLGVAAIIFARDDLASPPEGRPGFASAGMMLGIAGVAVSAALLVLWLLTPMPF
ncbi:hypothetical protein SZ60_07235 [Frigoribacterium sp. MEB024]|nr:hypothetical protein SZ60_07235 [Frigoribacterium sp. MEB024]